MENPSRLAMAQIRVNLVKKALNQTTLAQATALRAVGRNIKDRAQVTTTSQFLTRRRVASPIEVSDIELKFSG